MVRNVRHVSESKAGYMLFGKGLLICMHWTTIFLTPLQFSYPQPCPHMEDAEKQIHQSPM